MGNKHSKAPGITNAVLLQHMQGMRHSLESRIDHLETRFVDMGKHMNEFEHRTTKKFAETNGHLKRIDDALQRLYVHRTSMLGRIERLEEAVGIA